MSAEKLQKILDKGDLNACRKFFRGMPESQRRELHPIAAAQFKQLKRNEFVQVEPNSYQRNELLPATQLAYFATGTLSEIKQMGVWRHPDEDDVFEILFERKPDWIEDFVAMLLDSQSFFREWTLIRRLIAAKLATKPDVPNYYLGMIGCLGYRFSKTLMINQLLAEPDLLSDDIWKLFEIEGGRGDGRRGDGCGGVRTLRAGAGAACRRTRAARHAPRRHLPLRPREPHALRSPARTVVPAG